MLIIKLLSELRGYFNSWIKNCSVFALNNQILKVIYFTIFWLIDIFYSLVFFHYFFLFVCWFNIRHFGLCKLCFFLNTQYVITQKDGFWLTGKQKTSITHFFFFLHWCLSERSVGKQKCVQMCLSSPVCTQPLFPLRKHSPLASWVAQISKCAVNSAPWLRGRKQSNQYIINHRFNVAKPDVDKH